MTRSSFASSTASTQTSQPFSKTAGNKTILSSKLLGYLKEKVRPITFESFEVHYLQNSELYRIETFIEDLAFLNKHFQSFKKEAERIRQYFIYVNLFCFKKRVDSKLQVPTSPFCTGGEADSSSTPDVHKTPKRGLFSFATDLHDTSDFLLQPHSFI